MWVFGPVYVRSPEARIDARLRALSNLRRACMHWLLTTTVMVTVIFLLSRASYRIAAPFWSRQPVFHPYRLDMWFRSGIIEQDPPMPDRDVDRSIIKWQPVMDMTESQRTEITNFISRHFLRTPDAEYSPEWRHVACGMNGSVRPPVFCLGRDGAGALIAAISARCMTLSLPGRAPLEMYYIDNLCVHPGHRRRGLAPKSIRTLYQDISENVPDVRVYMFKREGKVMGVIPLTAFDVCAYQLGALGGAHSRTRSLDIRVPQGVSELRDAWQATLDLAEPSRVLVAPPASAVFPSIQSGALRLYTHRRGKATRAVALFRDPACTYKGDTFIELAAIVHDLSDDEAVRFLLSACKKAAKDTSASLVLLDCCGQTTQLVSKIKAMGRSPVHQTRTSLFLYNYVEKPHLAATCTFLF